MFRIFLTVIEPHRYWCLVFIIIILAIHTVRSVFGALYMYTVIYVFSVMHANSPGLSAILTGKFVNKYA